jgi:hypothetical protein
MSLRKSPTLTPALLASNRRNAQKSTGPRTARGKAWSRLNRLRYGGRSTQFLEFFNALHHPPPGPARVALVARALLAFQSVQHPLYLEMAELCLQVELDLCPESWWKDVKRRKKIVSTFKAGRLLKTRGLIMSVTGALDEL